jgi:hypothetical protein
MVGEKKPTVGRQCLRIAVLTAIAALPLFLGMSIRASAQGPSGPTPWSGPVPKAVCGSNDRVETGLQGHTTLAQRTSGDSERGYNCNLELVGQFQGEGMWWFGGGELASFNDCAYYATRNHPLQQRPGAVVIDASDPASPHPSTYLNDTATMLNPHESLKVHHKRQLLAGLQSLPLAGPGFAIYDLSADCRHPILKASIELAGTVGHAGNFTPDGMTYYATQMHRGHHGMLPIIDISDASNPKLFHTWEPGTGDGRPHDVSFNRDGTRMYAPQPGQFGNTGSSIGPNGLVVLDVSDIQFRRPDPQIRLVSTLFWEDGGQAQQTLPVTIKGRPHLIFTDEAGSGGVGGRAGACARGLPPSGFARIIDISDERNPRTIAKLMLEAHDPVNCAELLTTPDSNSSSNYSSHYCTADKAENPKLLACSYFAAGIRVFDITDPYRPREVAYYKPPARRTAFLPGSSIWSATADRTVDFTPTDIRWRRHKGETHLWFSSADNGFQIVRFTKSRHELLGKGKGKDQDDDN